MPDSYSIQDVDSFFKARLQDEARRIFATGALTRIYEAAVSRIPEVRFTLVGGARAYPRLGRIADYKRLKGERTVKVPFGGNGDKVVELRWDAPPTEHYLSSEDYRAVEAEILRLFSQQHTNSDYDLAAVVVSDGVRHKDDVMSKLLDEIRAACQDTSLRSSVLEIEAGLDVTIQDLMDKDKLKRVYDVREGFVFEEKEFLDIMKTYPQIWEAFRSSEDVSKFAAGKGEGNMATIKIKPPTRIEVRVANLRRENGALVALIEPSNGPKPYLQETLDNGALVVGDPRAEIWTALKEIDGLMPERKNRIRRLPQGWKAFVDYAKELEELGLLTNGLVAAKAEYESLAGAPS